MDYIDFSPIVNEWCNEYILNPFQMLMQGVHTGDVISPVNNPNNLSTPSGTNNSNIVGTIQIRRLFEDGQTTLGILKLNGRQFCFTLELPWRENQTDISRIPAKTYLGHVDLKHGWRIELEDTLPRKGVQVHIGNDESDTTGCILVGTKIRDKHFISGSKAALEALKTATFDSVPSRSHEHRVTIEVTDAFNMASKKCDGTSGIWSADGKQYWKHDIVKFTFIFPFICEFEYTYSNIAGVKCQIQTWDWQIVDANGNVLYPLSIANNQVILLEQNHSVKESREISLMPDFFDAIAGVKFVKGVSPVF